MNIVESWIVSSIPRFPHTSLLLYFETSPASTRVEFCQLPDFRVLSSVTVTQTRSDIPKCQNKLFLVTSIPITTTPPNCTSATAKRTTKSHGRNTSIRTSLLSATKFKRVSYVVPGQVHSVRMNHIPKSDFHT